MTFASRFESGVRTGETLLNAYEQARQHKLFQDIARAQPVATRGYTADQGEYLGALTRAADLQGNPYYSVAPDDAGGYQVGSNFQVQWEGGQMMTPEPVGLAPSTVTDFLGQRVAGTLTPEQIDNMRYGAYADAVGQFDPMAGLNMRQNQQRMALEQRRFGLDEQVMNNQQRDYLERKQLEQARREQFQRLHSMSPEELTSYAGHHFSPDGSGIPAMLTYDKNKNEFVLASEVPGLHSGTYSRNDVINAAMSVFELGNGDFNTGMQMMMDQISSQRGLQQQRANLAALQATSNAGLARDDRNYGIDLEQLALQRQQVANTGAQVQSARDAARMGSTQMFQGTDGNWYAVTPTYSKTGGVEFTTNQVNPPGVGLLRPGGTTGAGATKPTKVEEEGLIYNVPGVGPLKADGQGGFMEIDGVLTSNRAQHLRDQGVPKDLVERVEWHANGVQVTLDGKWQYNALDKREMRQMVDDYYRQRKEELREQEELLRQETERKNEDLARIKAQTQGATPGFAPGNDPAIFYPQFKRQVPTNKPPVGLQR